MMPSLPALALPIEAARLFDRTLDPALANAVAHAFVHAPFLRGLLRSRHEVMATIVTQGFDVALAAAMTRAQNQAQPVDVALRCAKGDVALITALADLGGFWPLEQVTRALSEFADLALGRAVAAALAEREAPNHGISILALGKLGSFELNYSSDVDIILLYEPTQIPLRTREEPADAAARIGRRIVQIMDAPTADGYVFRVDLRLRPSPEATPIALSFAAAEQHYQSEAQTWERVAFIRARSCAGDIARGEQFLDEIRPFIWRRSLDYTAIRDIQSVSLRIRDHYNTGQAVGPGYDVKRGRGGIREIEFFAQIEQMIWGGRNPLLRARATLEALTALTTAGHIPLAQAQALAQAYRFLRTVEHRLQMRADEQTHSIPTNNAHCKSATALMGFADWRSLERRLKAETRLVAAAYDRLIAEAGSGRLPLAVADLRKWLKAAGLPPAQFVPLIERWRTGSYRALRTNASRHSFEALLPTLLPRFAQAADPGHAAVRFDSFLAMLPAGLQFFALLQANPPLLPLLTRLLTITPVLADALARDAALLDILLAPDAFEPLADSAGLSAELRMICRGARTIEDVFDRVRRWTGERRFQLGTQLIEGHADPLQVAASLSDVADAAMAVLIDAVSDEFARSHGRISGATLIVIGMGRYGGRALTHASDLDLIYLFSGNFDAQSDGAKPLSATVYFNRLASRLTAALSVPTAAGALYEVDTRLRPSGGQGLLAVSIDSFEHYQRQAAWTWEHLALTRARVVAGNAGQIGLLITDILSTPRDPVKLRADVLEMRADIDAAKPGQGLWDVKLGKGGLVDIEFMLHFIQLRDARATSTNLHIALIELDFAPELIAAHDLLTRLLVMLRLVVVDRSGKVGALPPAVTNLLANATGHADFAGLESALALAKVCIVAAWEKLFDKKR